MKKKLLYLCTNDGTDMRINKEVLSLSKAFDVTYLGVGVPNSASFCAQSCENFILINGTIKSPLTIYKYWKALITLMYRDKFDSFHVVEEQLFLLLWPFLLRKKVVLDIFDSLFLKINKPNNKLYLVKRFIYGLANKIIVTDEFRKGLMPSFAFDKVTVIPNVPLTYNYNAKNTRKDGIVLCFFGSLAKGRGGELVHDLLSQDNDFSCVCAGWLADDYVKELIKNPKVTYLGIVTQQEANNYLSEHGDYLVSVYPISNLNNIYASPNKIYDTIHTKTPLIINSDILVSSFVKEKNIGLVINESMTTADILNELKDKKNSFHFDSGLEKKYCWEHIESHLVKLH